MYLATSSPRLFPKAYKNNRCVSLPVRSHPSVGKVQEDLCKLRSLSAFPWNSKTTMVSGYLHGLTELYKSFGDLFKSSDVHKGLSQIQHDGFMNELLEVSLRYLDVCGGAKDAASRIKKNVLELQSALRRSKKGGDFSIEGDVNAYVNARKEMKKELSKLLALTKETDAALALEAFPSTLSDVSRQISALVKVMQETSMMTCLVFNSVLTFLSSPGMKPKHKGWGEVIMKLVKKGCGEEKGEKCCCLELEAMEAELWKLVNEEEEELEEGEKIQRALMGSEAVEAAMEEVEEGLEGLFKVMIQARVSVLNSNTLSS